MSNDRAVARPAMALHMREGVMQAEHFQIAYVTNDIARACAIFRDRYGIRAFGGLDAETPGGGRIHIELTWVGGTMIELIEASGPETRFYTDRLPSGAFAIRHHHLGYLVDDEAAWDRLQHRIKAEKWDVVLEGTTEGFLKFCYIEAPELGHYLEYFLLEPAGAAFLSTIPAT